MNLDPQQLAALCAILRCGTFDAAAADLGLTQSAISQRLKALETRVGAQLVHRGQPSTGTAAGLRLAAHGDQIALLESQLARQITGLAPAPQTRLRLAVNADSLATWLPAALAELPDHLFDLVIDDQDAAHDRLTRGEVLGALTTRANPLPGCDAVALGNLRYIATASPGFMARHFPDGVTASDLVRAPMLRFDAKDRLQEKWMTRHLGRTVSPPCHMIPSSQGFVAAARLGLGWGLNPEALVADALASGALVPLLPDAALDTQLYWQSSRVLGAALTPLTRALRRAARQMLYPPA